MNKKRIGILTYHRSNNYGAFMQAYSLASRLRNDFPDCEINIIDYLSKEVFLLYHPSIWNLTRLIIGAKPLRRKLTYSKLLYNHCHSLLGSKKKRVNDQFFGEALKNLPLSEQHIVTDNLKKVSDYINEHFDIVVVGSDAVWNWQARKFPNAYFLGDAIKVKKLSYAASSYGQPFKKTTEKQREYIQKAWSSYSYIGVRDIATEDFVRWVDKDLYPHHNCDPTIFLKVESLPVDIESVKDKLKKAGFDFGKKTIGLMAKPTVAKYVCEELGDEYQIVSIFNNNECASINLLDINPFEWAVVFSFFNLTITHYFHGNLLSLKNGIPTLVIEERSAYNQEYCSKIRDFMKRINLEENCYYFDEMEKVCLKDRVNHIFRDENICEKIGKGMQKESNYYYSFKDALIQEINN